MKPEQPERPKTSPTIWTRRANEEFVVFIVSMTIAIKIEGLVLGYKKSGESESYTYWFLRIFMMGFINWFANVLYKRYRGE